MVELIDRFRGSLLGLAVGDALGHPTEFISSVERIRARFGPQGITDFSSAGAHRPGTFTDDTQMTICVARALIRKGHTDRDSLMTLLGDEFVAWAQHPSNNRAPGGTCLAGCRKLKQGAAWRDAGVKESKGCGAAMRAAPIGLYFFDDDEALVRMAAAQSVLTHSHPTGIASSVAAAAPVAWLCKGNGIDGILEYTKAMVERIDEAMLLELGAPGALARDLGVSEQLNIIDDTAAALSEDTDDVCQLLGGAWVGEEAVACALWCFLKADGDFDEAVRRGANSSGDSDSIACIAGSFAGALHGRGAIPTRFVEQLERASDLDDLAVKLWSARTQGDEPTLPAHLDFFDAERPRARSPSPPGGSGTTDESEDDESEDGEDDDDDGVATQSAAESGMDEVSALERDVVRHNELYWVHAAPEISDPEFDALTRRLTELKPDSDVLRHLGSRPDSGKAVRHEHPMLSLDKCYEESELQNWLKDFSGDVVVMPKIDGLACSLHYDEAGKLVRAATRGDGEVGEDITPNVRAISDVPQTLSSAVKGPVEVRGEVYMSLAAFEKHRGDKANPRNLAAGALRQKDPNKTRAYGLSFFAYDARRDDFMSQREKLAFLKDAGVKVVDTLVVPSLSAQEAVATMSGRRDELGFEADGVVIVVDAVAEQRRLGITNHHPRYAIAWKFQGEEGHSVLVGVEWSVARTGTITPVALVEPVVLSGATVTRATLHHRGFVEKLGLSIGARIAMVRRGGVIPHVERVLEAGAAPVLLPAVCPACGADVVVDGDFLVCGRPQDCVAARVGRILHFAEAADIQGLGDAIVEQAVAAGILKTSADIYRLRPGDLARLERCGDKAEAKILAEVKKAQRLSLDAALRGLGIEGLGKTAARAVAETFGSFQRVRAATEAELTAMKGIGAITAAAIVDGLKANAELLDELAGFVRFDEVQKSGSGPFEGRSFVFTGALTFDRKGAEARVKSLGGTVPSGVTKALSYLVVGASDRASPSTKQKAAENLIAEGAPLQILDEAAFESLLQGVAASTDGVTSAPGEVSTPPSLPTGLALPLDEEVSVAAANAAEATAAPKKQLTLF